MAKFRSWNEKFKMFIYFEDGFYQKGCGKWTATRNEGFNWQNAELCRPYYEKEFFIGDNLELELPVNKKNEKGEWEVVNTILFKGVLKLDKTGIYLDSDKGKLYPINLNRCKLVGNIHE